MAKYSTALIVSVVLLAVATGRLQAGEPSPRIVEVLRGTFNVSVDHFRNQNSEQAIFEFDYNIQYFDRGGPLFFYINDADTYTTEWIQHGLVYDLASELGGALFTANMRFMRFNLPSETVTFEDLSVLTVEQVLADLVTLVQAAHETVDTDARSKAYVWGRGWGGTLAVLARQKFPNVFAGAWSSSGIFEPAVFTTDNYDILSSHVFEYGGDACGMALHHAFHTLDHVLMHRDEGRIVREFGLCRPWNITEMMDRMLFVDGLLDQINDYVNWKHFAGIQSLCEALDAIPSDPFASLARWVRFTYGADFGNCFNYDYMGRLRWLADTQFHNPGTASGKRQTLYMSCMQLGQLRVTQPEGLFGHHVMPMCRQRMCQDALGDAYDFNQLEVNVERFRTMYGGTNPRATGIILTNGMLDTWLSHGITNYEAHESFVINIPGYGKSGDMQSVSVHDSTVMYTAKHTIKQIIRNWVRDIPNEL